MFLGPFDGGRGKAGKRLLCVSQLAAGLDPAWKGGVRLKRSEIRKLLLNFSE